MTKRDYQDSKYYIDNEKLATELTKFYDKCVAAKEAGEDLPEISNYIGDCIMKICEGVSNRPNFVNYTWKEFMVSDAMIACVKAVYKYNPYAETRSGTQNPHGYLSRAAWWAMIPTIKSEKKVIDAHESYKNSSGLEAFMCGEDIETQRILTSQTEQLKRDREKMYDEFDDGIERTIDDYDWHHVKKD